MEEELQVGLQVSSVRVFKFVKFVCLGLTYCSVDTYLYVIKKKIY